MNRVQSPSDPPRRPRGSFDLLVVGAVVAVLFTVGALLGSFDGIGRLVRTWPHFDELLGLAVLMLTGMSIIAVRSAEQARQDRLGREEAEAKFRALVEDSPAVTYTWDSERRRHLYVSPQIERLLGYSADEWRGDPELWSRVIHPSDRDRIVAASDEADRTRTHFLEEYRTLTKDGRVIWIRDESHYVVVSGEQPVVTQGVMYDITAQKKAEALAAESEARFRTIVERVPAISYIWDGADEHGQASPAYISPQIGSVLGVSAEDWLADPNAWDKRVHPDDGPQILERWAQSVGRGSGFVGEYRMRRSDGSWVWIHDEATPVGEGKRGRPTYQGVMFDVTERREAEERLRDAETRWRTLLEHLPVTAYAIEYDLGPGGRIHDRWVAPGIATLLGVSPETWIADPNAWIERVHADDRERADRWWSEEVERGGTHDLEYRMVAEDGRIVWVYEEVASSRWDERFRAEGVLIDVTARREAERALGAAESRLQALVEQLPAITYIEDPQTGENVYVSPQIEEMYGYTAAEWKADPDLWTRCLHPEDRDWVVASNAADNGDAWSVDYRSISKTGRTFWVHNEARLIRDEDGEPLYWLGLAFDVTERMNAEGRLREAEERYRALVEQLPVAIYTDAVDDVSTALYISPRYEQLTGYSAEQRLQDPGLWVRMLHPDDREAVLAESQRTNETGEPFDIEYRIMTADGRTVWLHDNAVLVEAGTGTKIWQGVLQDVTERRVAQDALSRRDAILQATGFAAEQLLRSASWEEVLADVLERIGVAAEASRVYVVANETDEELTTSPKQTWRSSDLTADARGLLESRLSWRGSGLGRWADLLGEGQPIHGPIDELPASERSVAGGPQGDVVSILLVPIFVADRWWGSIGVEDCRRRRDWHEAEIEALTVTANTVGAAIAREGGARELSDTQRRYRTLVEQIPAMTYIERADHGGAIYYSPQVHDVLGYVEGEWGSYQQWADAVHPDDLERVLAEDRRTNETGEPFHVEYRLIAKDGHSVWVRDDAVLVRAPDGTPEYWQGVRFDVTAEKEAEAYVRAAEERYRQLVEETPAITYLDERVGRAEDDWNTIYISPQLERILGYTPSEWMDEQGLWGRSILEPDDAERARQADLHHYRTGEPLDIELRVRTRSGDVRWIRDQAVVLRNDQGRPTWSQGIMLDITEQKKAEQALNDAEERYRSLIETLPAVTYIDPIGDPLTTIYVSPQIESILGYTAEEWNRSDEVWREHLHPDDREATEAAMARHDETGEPLDVVYRFQHHSGHWLWVRDQAVVISGGQGEPRFSQGVMLDITATKTAEDRLREAEERYRGIVEHVPAAIYLDRADESMESVYVSPQIEEIVGVSPAAWMADPELWIRLMHSDDRAVVQRSYLDAIDARTAWSAEYRLQTPDGRTIWVHDEITFLHDEAGNPVYMQGVIFDITERKLAEQALRESEQRERDAAERLRALDEMKNTFLAAVSHELRSPLTSILGLSLTLERAPDMRTDDRGDLLRRLATNARKLDQLLKDLLDIDRLNRGIVEPQYRATDVGALARRTIESLDALAGRPVVVETESVIVAVDPAKIERVVENLLMNAARHTAGDRRIWLRVSSLDGGVLIKVEDDGPGVAPELRDVIFEPFRQGPTASSHAPGTGIGLSLVARFAELHGGRAWVGEREGGGASFRVFIPGQPNVVAATPTRPTERESLPHATAESA